MNIKVLMADDEPEVLEIMAKRVSAQGYDVVTANNGLQAWEKIQTESPDVIVLDLNMPKMSGFDVLKELRLHPLSEKWQPVIIVSTRGELEDVQKGLAMEAEHYLVKPCAVEEVIKAIRLMVSLIPHHKPPSELEDDDMELIE